jgi:hypothetical protein
VNHYDLALVALNVAPYHVDPDHSSMGVRSCAGGHRAGRDTMLGGIPC